jgi:hypothetical protein
MILTVIRDYLLEQHWPVDLCNGEEFVFSLLYDWILKYGNPSVYEQSVYEFSLIRYAQINTFFFNLRANFRLYELLPLANRSLLPSGSNGKLIFVLRVFAVRAVLEERIKLVNRGITVLFKYKYYSWNNSVSAVHRLRIKALCIL